MTFSMALGLAEARPIQTWRQGSDLSAALKVAQRPTRPARITVTGWRGVQVACIR